MNYFYAFFDKKFVWGYFRYHHMIEYFRTNIHYSIFNIQFPDKSGFTLRYNRLVRVRDVCQ